jgi:hypothetical protein
VLVASQLIGTDDGRGDYFRADRAWFYVVLLNIGYLIPVGWPSPEAGTSTTPGN